MTDAAESPPPTPVQFKAGKAIAVLVLFFVAQVIVSVGVLIFLVLVAAIKGANLQDAGEVQRLTSSMTVPLVIASALTSAGVLLLLTRAWAWPLLKDPSPNGLGWRAATRRQVLGSTLAGMCGCIAYLAMAHFLFPPTRGTPLGPLVTLAVGGGVGRVVWAVLAVLFAPPLEEFLFRGLLLRGLSASWGLGAASVIVTIVFVSFHLFETFHYLPALIGITYLAIAALVARVKTGSLVPAIAVHAAYNFTLVVLAYAK